MTHRVWKKHFDGKIEMSRVSGFNILRAVHSRPVKWF